MMRSDSGIESESLSGGKGRPHNSRAGSLSGKTEEFQMGGGQNSRTSSQFPLLITEPWARCLGEERKLILGPG